MAKGGSGMNRAVSLIYKDRAQESGAAALGSKGTTHRTRMGKAGCFLAEVVCRRRASELIVLLLAAEKSLLILRLIARTD